MAEPVATSIARLYAIGSNPVITQVSNHPAYAGDKNIGLLIHNQLDRSYKFVKNQGTTYLASQLSDGSGQQFVALNQNQAYKALITTARPNLSPDADEIVSSLPGNFTTFKMPGMVDINIDPNADDKTLRGYEQQMQAAGVKIINDKDITPTITSLHNAVEKLDAALAKSPKPMPPLTLEIIREAPEPATAPKPAAVVR